MSVDRGAALRTLVLESRELLDSMERALLGMESGGADPEGIDAVFRAAHTIKGSAGLFGLDGIVAFAHEAEETLDGVRAGTIPVDGGVLSLFLECGDHLRAWIDRLDADPDSVPEAPVGEPGLVDRLRILRGAGRALVPPAPLEPRVEVVDVPAGGTDLWLLSFRPAPDLLRCGLDPLQVVAYLGTFCEEVRVGILEDRLPRLAEADPTSLYLDFEIQLRTDASRERILDAFEFVSDGSRIRLVPPHSRVDEYLDLLEGFPESGTRLGEMLVACGALGRKELENALSSQEALKGLSSKPPPAIGEVLVAQQVVPPAVVDAALQRQEGMRARQSSEKRTVRVEAGKLDALIDLVGELVIAGASARLIAAAEGARECEASLASLSELLERIRESAMSLRMVPVGEVFQRFPRLVRDLSKELGKRIDLRISGAETSLDKSMVDRIVDPLTHIVRNALDHGIESEAVRAAAGKPTTGTLSFDAFAESGSVVIEVRDDGAGIDRAKVLAKARARGLVPPESEPSDREILDLVFLPGFSTTESVTDISGRGVGMDVVRRNVEELRGEIELESEPGCGTTVRMRLPLTLAIIDGFLVEVGKRGFVVPLDTVVECADLPGSGSRDGVFRLREETLPLVRLREVFGIRGAAPPKECLVVARVGSRKVGLVVDHLAGERQAVIKPLGPLFRELRAVGGTTVLGDGSIALILDLAQLHRIAAHGPAVERIASNPPSKQNEGVNA